MPQDHDGRAESWIASRRVFLARAGATTMGLAVGGGLAAACGASKSTTTSASGAKPKPGLKVGILTDLDTFNPLNTVSILETHWLVYDKLMQYNAKLQPALQLATSREASSDGLTVTFALNPAAKFHDGKPLTSADVKFTFELIRSTQLSFAAPYLSDLVDVQTPDAKTVVTRYSKAPADDPAAMTAILPQHIFTGMSKEQLIKFANEPMVGSGPFKFKNRKHGQSWEFVANPDYWGKKPGLSSVSWLIFGNPEAMAIALRQGTLDVTYPLSTSIWTGLKGAADVTAAEYRPLGFDHFGSNVWSSKESKGNPLLLDKTIRQALALCIDREKLVQLVLEGHGEPGSTVIPPAMGPWHADIPAAQQLTYDPARARAILDAAGYRERGGVRVAPDGKPLQFRLFTSTVFDRLKKASELIIEMAKAIGVKLDLTVMQDATLAERVFTSADYDCFVWTWTTPPNPTFMLSVQASTTFHVLSDTYYANPEFDKVFEEQKSEADPAKRKALVDQAQTIFYEDAPYTVLYYPSVLEAYRTDKLAGWLEIDNGVTDNWTTANYLALTGK
jgi:peptide/nickel transport system substrate-binding protein